jgi:hypothetical protein
LKKQRTDRRRNPKLTESGMRRNKKLTVENLGDEMLGYCEEVIVRRVLPHSRP